MKKYIICLISVIALMLSSCEKEIHHYGNCWQKDGVIITSEISSPNSVGGVNVYITIQNYSGKTIKYVSMAGDMRNYFGDNVYCEITRDKGMSIDITGPIDDGETQRYVTNDCFYNSTAREYCINAVSLQFVGEEMKHYH